MAPTQSASAPPIAAEALAVTTLGTCTVRSPLGFSTRPGDGIPDYVPDDVRVALEVESFVSLHAAPPPAARPLVP